MFTANSMVQNTTYSTLKRVSKSDFFKLKNQLEKREMEFKNLNENFEQVLSTEIEKLKASCIEKLSQYGWDSQDVNFKIKNNKLVFNFKVYVNTDENVIMYRSVKIPIEFKDGDIHFHVEMYDMKLGKNQPHYTSNKIRWNAYASKLCQAYWNGEFDVIINSIKSTREKILIDYQSRLKRLDIQITNGKRDLHDMMDAMKYKPGAVWIDDTFEPKKPEYKRCCVIEKIQGKTVTILECTFDDLGFNVSRTSTYMKFIDAKYRYANVAAKMTKDGWLDAIRDIKQI